jgi:hypothetical protein
MAHFAELDKAGYVISVVVVNDAELMVDGNESESAGVAFLKSLYGHSRWKRTSYSGAFRGCYAGIGYRYDATSDTFIP